MLQAFTKQEDIPEAFREHYSKREDGLWHADIPNDHPSVKHNAKLLSEKSTAEGKVTQLTSDLESARAGNLGRGQVAVTKADVALLDEYKALGQPAEVKTKLTEHETLKSESEKRTREDKLLLVGKELGFDNTEAFKLLADLPDFDIREKDGKKSVIALVKDGDKVVEKPAMEFLEGSPRHAPFLPALKTKPTGVTVNPTGATQTQSQPGDPFAWAKNFAEAYSKGSQPVTDLAKSFSERSA